MLDENIEKLCDALDELGVGCVAICNDEIVYVNNTACICSECSEKDLLRSTATGAFIILDGVARQPLDPSQLGPQFRDVQLINSTGTESHLRVSCLRGLTNNYEFLLLAPLERRGAGGDVLRFNRRVGVIAQLVGGVAHDLNNMLGGIMGSAELLVGTVKGKAGKLVNNILESSSSAAELNQKLLSFTRPELQQAESFDLHSAVRDALDLLRRSIDRKIEIKIDFVAGTFFVDGDEAELKSAILNLGINSRDAMPNGGELRVSTAVVPLGAEDPVVKENSLEPGDYVLLAVQDNGCGIPAKFLGRIFDPYFTTKPRGDSAGVGLSWVAECIEEFSGAINVRSEVGRGTRFDIYLPLVQGASIPKRESTRMYAAKSRRGELVLVADDEPLMRSAISAMLDNLGYRVIEAEDGEEAVRIYMDHGGEISLVILDMLMPKMDGRDTFLSIRALNPQAAVLLVSGYTGDRSFSDIKQLGVREVLQKPFSMVALQKAIDKALGNSEPAGEEPVVDEENPVEIEDKPDTVPHLPVLLIEPEDTMREVITGMLENRGYDVMALAEAEDAVMLLQSGQRYPVYVFDVNLDAGAGLKLCRLARDAAEKNPCYVIIITNHSTGLAQQTFLEGGADDFIVKPFTLDLLAVRVDVARNHTYNARKRLEAEKALRDNEERMALAISSAELGVWEVHVESGKAYVSDMWRHITGYEGEGGAEIDFVRSNLHPGDRNRVVEAARSYLDNGAGVFNEEFRMEHPSKGYIWVMGVGKAVERNSAGSVLRVSGFFQDITVRKQSQLSMERQRRMLEEMVMERTEELVKINEELREEMEARARAEKDNLRQQKKLLETERLASLGTLVSGVGHEINNPTQFIMLNMPFLQGAWESALEVLDDYYAEHDDLCLRGVPYAMVRERLPVMAKDIMEGAQRIEKIVRELKDYARKRDNETFEEVDLRKTVDSATTLLGHFIRQHTDHFVVETPAEALTVRAHATRIEQVIINLVQNSCLALSDRSGSVKLSLLDRGRGQGADIVVKDTGHGIEPDHMPHLTDPFFTTRQTSGGTGLGLSICQRIVHDHNGELLFSSEPGEGTTVTVRLPFDPGKEKDNE